MRFLATLQIPIVATFRDSQTYIRGAELGVGIHEMKSYLVREDIEQWNPLVDWLESRSPQPQATAASQAAALQAAAIAAGGPAMAHTAVLAGETAVAEEAAVAGKTDIAEEAAAAAEPLPIRVPEGGSPY
jgi:hypothetical protein